MTPPDSTSTQFLCSGDLFNSIAMLPPYSNFDDIVPFTVLEFYAWEMPKSYFNHVRQTFGFKILKSSVYETFGNAWKSNLCKTSL